MRRLFQRISARVNQFVEQRDDLVCFICCTDNDSALVAQVVGDLDQQNGADLFLHIPDQYTNRAEFVSLVVQRIQQQHELANEILLEEKRPTLPEIPVEVRDARELQPEERFLLAILFAKSLLPNLMEHRLIVSLCPMEIADVEDYADFVGSFVPWQGVRDWMCRTRFIFRLPDQRTSLSLRRGQQILPESAPRTQLLPVDLGPDALANGLAEDASDEELSDEERIQSYLALAMLDSGHSRFDDALDKYDQTLGYYQQTDDVAMQAFVMHAIGEVYYRQQDFEQALHWYECAVPPVIESDARHIFLLVTQSLGRTNFAIGNYDQAEQYFDGADKLAANLKDPQAKADALRWCGLARERQNDLEGAAECLENSRLLSKSIGMDTKLKESLQDLLRIREAMGSGDLEDLRFEIADLPEVPTT